MGSLRELFLLDPSITYLNHGSFGATPEPVFREYQRWQRELERQPTEFLGRRFEGLMRSAREALASYVGVRAEDVVYVTNATVAVNIVARSLELGPGDQVLASDHEYGACDRTWRFLARKRGFSYIRRPIAIPLESGQAVVADFMAGVTGRTKVIFISHITSPTAIILPVEEICRQARSAGILSIVDGAHGPGQLPLDLLRLGADLYGGNLHKWLCSPKGSGFLFARPEVQHLLEPLVVSWGYEAEQPGNSEFTDLHEWQGTRDPAAFLTVPAAIAFQQEYHWDEVRATCHARLTELLDSIAGLATSAAIYPDDSWYAQMASAILPPSVQAERLQSRLRDDFLVEVPVRVWNEQNLIRISLQAYNDSDDVERLLQALKQLL